MRLGTGLGAEWRPKAEGAVDPGPQAEILVPTMTCPAGRASRPRTATGRLGLRDADTSGKGWGSEAESSLPQGQTRAGCPLPCPKLGMAIRLEPRPCATCMAIKQVWKAVSAAVSGLTLTLGLGRACLLVRPRWPRALQPACGCCGKGLFLCSGGAASDACSLRTHKPPALGAAR